VISKLLTSSFLIFLITSFCLTIVAAQTPPPPPAKPLPPPKQAKPARIVGKAKVFEFKTATSYSSVFLNRDGKQIITATFKVSNERTGEDPESMWFIYRSFSGNGYKYKDNRRITIVIDDERSAQTEARIILASCSRKIATQCYEVLSTPLLSFQFLAAMLDGNVVEIEIGDTVFELSKEELEGLKDLQRALKK